MADEFRTDEEQAEVLKRWFDENGTSLIVGIVVALGGVFGYQTWENSVQEYQEAASATYQELIDAAQVSVFEEVTEENLSTSTFLSEKLKGEYEDTAYAVFGALQMAKLRADNGEWEKAATELKWAQEHTEDNVIKVLAAIRLARVTSELGDHDQALQILDGLEAGAQGSSLHEARGDVLFAMGREQDAREAYQLAVNTLVEGATKPALQMKLDDLSVAHTSVGGGTEGEVGTDNEDGSE